VITYNRSYNRDELEEKAFDLAKLLILNKRPSECRTVLNGIAKWKVDQHFQEYIENDVVLFRYTTDDLIDILPLEMFIGVNNLT
jgi:hypothetical protein